MEFLVRLEDKTNIQVFCYNPVHKGNHMDRVFYEDNTFSVACPECGSDKFLYRKNNAITKKGHFITFKPDGWTWGINERKHYGIVRIDCIEEEAQELCAGIIGDRFTERPRKNKLDYEKFISFGDLKSWNNKAEYSPIITMSTDDKLNIKEQ